MCRFKKKIKGVIHIEFPPPAPKTSSLTLFTIKYNYCDVKYLCTYNLVYKSLVIFTTYEYLQDILKFIEESKNGVIFFTFGAVVALSTIPDHIQIAFKNPLAEVPQSVVGI